MAGDWIKMRIDLRSDPAVFKLAALTKLDRFAVIGRLAEFWGWVDKHAVDGAVDGATSQVVDDVASFDGFADAMVQIGWLVVNDDSIEIPNYDHHNSESAKERGLKNARQARWRANKGNNVDAPSSTEPSTNTSTREEKRREEKKEAPAAPVFVLPDWIQKPAWDGYVEMRKKARKAMTPRAMVLRVADLKKLHEAGHDVSKILDKSTANGWTDVYEPKAGQGSSSAANQLAGAI